MAHLVRPVTIADADALGVAHVEAWRAAYRGAMPDEFLDGLDPAARADRWRDILVSGSDAATWVTELDGDVVGFASAGPCRDEDADVGEVWAINLAPVAWGRGLGRALMDAALDALRAAGHREAVLWVVDRNERARRFYEIGGWTVDGGTKVDAFGGAEVTEVRYRRPL